MNSSILASHLGRLERVALLIATFATCAASALAQSGLPSSGPPGGFVNGVASDGEDVVMATDHGVASLAHVDRPYLLGQRANGVAIMGRHVLVSTDSATILRTTDWTRPAIPMVIDTGLRSLHIIGQDQRHIYAAAIASSGDPVRVYRTADTGTSWTTFYSASQGWEIVSVSVNEDSAAIASQSGIWVSHDDGVGWRQVSSRMLPFVLLSGNWITSAGPEGFGISTDFGASWTYSNNGLPQGVTITAHARGGGYFLIGTSDGVFHSVDSGRTWARYTAGLTHRSVTALTHKGDSVLAGTAGGGVNYRLGESEPWRPLPLWQTATVNALAYTVGDVILAATDGGIYRQLEWEKEWYYSGLHDRIAALQVVDSIVLAGSADSGVFRSLDLGKTWTHSSTGLGDTATRILSFLHSDGDLVVATNAGLFRSLDTGVSWMAVEFPSGKIFRALRSADFERTGDSDIYFGGGGFFLNADYGIFARSTDNGATWSVIEGDDVPIAALAEYTGRLWRGVAGIYSNGLYYSWDKGTTWTQVMVDTAGGEVSVLALRVGFNPTLGDVLYVCHSRGLSHIFSNVVWGTLGITSAPVTSIVWAREPAGVKFTIGTLGAGAFHWYESGCGVSATDEKRLSVRPNPARDRLTIEADADLAGRVCVTLHDGMGRTVREVRTSDAASAGVSLDTRGLPDGVYVVRLVARGVQHASTVIITH